MKRTVKLRMGGFCKVASGFMLYFWCTGYYCYNYIATDMFIVRTIIIGSVFINST
jgi:hypothetical protein